ncbi:MAG: RNA polymerase sigma factor [Clostridium sp.]|uniref:RNA polymerase sigma factor n=1 Tax=Clostridium sp. TaxID=1506 RepID=UPI003D6DA6FC
MEDHQIVERLRNKDNECFIETINKYKRKVISLCYAYTQDYFEAEDLSQEVFIALYNNIVKFREECSLSTYIYKISMSKALDYKRKRSIKGFLTGLFNTNIQHNECDIDEKNHIRQCINSLPRDLKQVIVLYYYIGLSQKEIASVINISQKTVEGRVYRAKQKLKIEIQRGDITVCKKIGMI